MILPGPASPQTAGKLSLAVLAEKLHRGHVEPDLPLAGPSLGFLLKGDRAAKLQDRLVHGQVPARSEPAQRKPTSSPRRAPRSTAIRYSRPSSSSAVAARNRAASSALHRCASGVSSGSSRTA